MKLFRQSLVQVLGAGLIAGGCTRVDVQSAPVEPQFPPSSTCDGPIINPAQSFSIFAGDTVRFSVVPCAFDKTMPHRWHVGQPAIAEIDSISGLMLAKSVGTALVTVYPVVDPNMKSGAVVNVVSRP